jgi:hypothetical protein
MVGKPGGRRPLRKAKCRWVDIVKIDIAEIGRGGEEGIELGHHRDQYKVLVNAVVNLWVQYNAEKFLSRCTTGGLSRRAQLRGVSLV